MKTNRQIWISIAILTALVSLMQFSRPEEVVEQIQNIELINAKYEVINWNPYKFVIDNEETYYEPINNGYRYGSALLKDEEDNLYMWMSSPGNNTSEWDWIRYTCKSDEEWSEEEIVLKPTASSKDSCSVCDPGIIYFNNYYYLAYTSTSYSQGNGMNNSAFVARSKNPAGPYEKWNGSGWGGEPEPIIEYKGNPEEWGLGEVSMLIMRGNLWIYYSYLTKDEYSTRLAKADISENWPLTIKEEGIAYRRGTNDSLEVVYDDFLNTYLAFTIKHKMTHESYIQILESKDGTDFKEVATIPCEKYAHNIGIEKNNTGHINTRDGFKITYAYGPEWGKWAMNIMDVSLE